jgi:hypothetical protein
MANNNSYISPGKPFTLLVIILFYLVLASSPLAGLEISENKYYLAPNNKYYIPYVSNYPINTFNSDIEHAILSVHSLNYNAYMALNNCKKIISISARFTQTTLVIAPQFLMKKHLTDSDPNSDEQNLLHWTVYPFWGSSRAAIKSSAQPLNLSAYDILETIISSLCNKTTFPNLKRITILGHSAGGQLVIRFAAANTVEDTAALPAGVKIRYIVMNPSSYVYLTPERPVIESELKFAIPSDEQIKKIPNYNYYGYGLDKLYGFHRRKKLTPQTIKDRFPARNVIYLLGQNDVHTGGGLDTGPAALLQGPNRLERGKMFYQYLQHVYGLEITKHQKIALIPNAGHSSRQIISSRTGTRYILYP